MATNDQTPKTFQDMDTKVGDMLTCVTSYPYYLYTVGESYEVLEYGLQDNMGSCSGTCSTFVHAAPYIDYNDGKWHEWTGGENPVHPLSEVHYTVGNGYTNGGQRLSGVLRWDIMGSHGIVAFRVSKVYPPVEIKEPTLVETRELWFVKDFSKRAYLRLDYAPNRGYWDEVIHVKEVLTLAIN